MEISKPTSRGEGSILFVCEGNVCRSAFAAAVLAARLSAMGIAVSSAGTGALVDSDMDPLARRAAEALVGPVGPHRARQITAELIEAADVVLCATRAQRDQAAAVSPSALGRAFALRDFAGLLNRWDGSNLAGSDPLRSLVARLVGVAASHRGTVPMAEAEAIDIRDPYRRGSAAFDRMREEVLPSLEQIEKSIMALSC